MIRNDWTREEITEIYNTPVLELIYKAATVHRQYHDAGEVQVCTLLSVKTEVALKIAYCPCGAARYHTDVPLLEVPEVMQKAIEAKEAEHPVLHGRGMARSARQQRF